MSKNESLFGAHLGETSLVHSTEEKLDSDIESVAEFELWEDLQELGGDSVSVDGNWEEVSCSRFENRVYHVLMDPNLFAKVVFESWWHSNTFNRLAGRSVVEDESVEEDLDKILGGKIWGFSHGKVNGSSLHYWDNKSEWACFLSLESNVQCSNLGVDELTKLWELSLDNSVDESNAEVDKSLEERVLHLDGQLVEGEGSGVLEGPVNVISVDDWLQDDIDGDSGQVES